MEKAQKFQDFITFHFRLTNTWYSYPADELSRCSSVGISRIDTRLHVHGRAQNAVAEALEKLSGLEGLVHPPETGQSGRCQSNNRSGELRWRLN